MTTIPPWVVRAGTLNGQNEIAKTQANIAAAHTTIPIVYGEQQIGGRRFALKFNATTLKWTVGYLLCVGEINAFTAIYLDGAAAKAGVVVNTYTGTTSQAADALLATEIAGYADTLVLSHPSGNLGFAYLVIQYTNDHYKAPPQVVAHIQGRKIFDPDTSTTVYSASPALALRDVITSPHFGLGGLINDTSVSTVKADNAATVTTEARRIIGISLDAPQETLKWIETLQSYAGCWAFKRGDTWQLVSDRPRSSDATITKHDVVKGSFALSAADPSDVPTVVRVAYTDTSTTIWREREAIAEAAGVSAGTTPRRESFVRMPGITRYSQAKREAEERLAKLQRGVLGISFLGFDEQLAREVGDVITVTHPHGVSGETFRITEPPRLVQPGRVAVRAVAYSASDYNDSEATASYGAADQVNGTESALPDPGATAGNPGQLPFYEDFSDNDLARVLSYWSEVADIGGEESIVAETGTPPSIGGQYVLQLGNNSGDDEVSRALSRTRAFPIEDNVLYRVVAHFRRISGSGTISVGIAGVAANRTAWVNSAAADALTSQHLFAANAFAPGSSAWQTKIGYFKRTGATATTAEAPLASAPGILHNNAKFAVPVFFTNVDNAAGSVQIGYIAVEPVAADAAISMAQLEVDSVSAIVTATDAFTNINTDYTSSWNTVLTAEVNIGVVKDTQRILVLFETDWTIWADWDSYVQTMIFRVTDDTGTQVATRFQVVRLPATSYVQPMRTFYRASNQTINSTTFATLTTISTVGPTDSTANAWVTVSSGEYSQDDAMGETWGDIWHVHLELNWQETGNQATGIIAKAQQFISSTWTDIAGTERRDGALNFTNDRHAVSSMSFAVNLRSGKIRFQAALITAGQSYGLLNAHVTFRRQSMRAYHGSGDNYGNGHTAFQMVIPTSNLVPGANTITVQAAMVAPDLDSAELNDSNAAFVVLKR